MEAVQEMTLTWIDFHVVCWLDSTHVFSLLIVREILNAGVMKVANCQDAEYKIWVIGTSSSRKYQCHPQKSYKSSFNSLSSLSKLRLWIAVVPSDPSRDVYGVQYVKTVAHSIQSIQGHPVGLGFLSQPPSSLCWLWSSQVGLQVGITVMSLVSVAEVEREE